MVAITLDLAVKLILSVVRKEGRRAIRERERQKEREKEGETERVLSKRKKLKRK